MKNPTVVIDFTDPDGNRLAGMFGAPCQTIVASRIEEVVDAIRNVECAVRHGMYAVGYIAYEAAPAFDPALRVHVPTHDMPLVWFGLFDEICDLDEPVHGAFHVSDWKPTVHRDTYNAAIQQIRVNIADGVTYQVNYTIRMNASFHGDDLAYFHRIRKVQGGGYNAYLNTGRFRVLSVSPELFFHWGNGVITTKPMKGTVRRGKWVAEDERLRTWLQTSEKNRAENLMIVDLLRNDLGRICETGSVSVPALFDVEKYPTVYQMTSTVTGQTKEGTTLVDVLSSLFPCGSVTGAPKVSTMRIISELEGSARNVYCGAVGIMTPAGQAIFNVAIRTVVIDTETGIAECGVGGGITWDSTAEHEYDEVVAKSMFLKVQRPTFGLLETLRLDNGDYYLLERHLSRLHKSAQYFSMDIDMDEIRASLAKCAQSHHVGRYKVRLVVHGRSNIEVTVNEIQTADDGIPVASLADRPVNSNDIFLFHKTTNRSVYESFRKPDSYDVLLWNEKGECTEFTSGNVVVELEGALWTPPLSCGLLPGTLREHLMEAGVIQERVIRKEDLQRASRIWFINSVRGWVEVDVRPRS
jgi:para-aminobenzoate synthetase / 4-amino-4-deoxychorismate lyase